MTEIVSAVNELKALEIDITNHRKILRKFFKRKKELESQIFKFLEAKEQPGLKYKDITIIAEKKEKHKRLKKKEKLQLGKDILNKFGITHNSDQILKELMDKLKGEKIPNNSLKIKNQKNNSS